MNSPYTILIVDDDPDDAGLLMEAISEIAPQSKCFCIMDGKAALEFLERIKILPNLIFLDLNMPKLNGFECLKEIKKVHQWSVIPVVIYTTSKQKEDEILTRKLGAVDFITKPSNFEDIHEIAKKTIEKYSPVQDQF
ncbi:MAG TPA: response regulator [Chitinophagales bacterium]|nr:response regulator [Chitinophagales bacterium]